MSSENPTLIAEPREKTGSRYSQRLRKAGRLPAVIYGQEEAPEAISLNAEEILRTLHAGAHVIELKIGKEKNATCLVKDLQFGCLGDDVIHIDFARVNLNQEVTVKVSLEFHGEAPESKKPGAIFRSEQTDLEVICKVRAIPDSIRVDLGAMETMLTIADIELPPGVRCEADPTSTIASIIFVQEEEELGEEADVTTEGAEPEVITESKSDETEDDAGE